MKSFAGYDCSSALAKMVIDFPLNLENLKPNSCPQRRFSTSNSIIKISEQIPPPNYLRASIGSCHDLCKYGLRRNFSSESMKLKQDKARSETNRGGNKVSGTKRLDPGDMKHKPLARSNQSAVKQPKKAILKSTNDIRTSRNDASRGIRSLRASKKSSPVPLTTSVSGSSAKVPSEKIRTSKRSPKNVSQKEIKNSVEDSMTCKKTSCENVPEKIINVVEPNDVENRNEDLDQDGDRCTEMSSNPNQKLKKDSASESSIPKENDSSPRKLKIKMENVVEFENRDVGPKAINLRRAVSDGGIIHSKNVSMGGALQAIEQENTNPVLMNTLIEETASKPVKMSRSKVKALVDAFETLINIQDSERPIAYVRSVYI